MRGREDSNRFPVKPPILKVHEGLDVRFVEDIGLPLMGSFLLIFPFGVFHSLTWVLLSL